MKTIHPSNPRTPQLADAAGELLLYRVSWAERRVILCPQSRSFASPFRFFGEAQ